jgi:hypothetical protein
LNKFFVWLLISLTTFTVLAQETDTGQSAKLPRTRDAERIISDRPHRNMHNTLPTDLAPLLFLPAVAYDSGGYTASSIAVADVNTDGKLDLVVGNNCANSGCPGDGSIGVMLGNGDGTFQPAVVYDTGGVGSQNLVRESVVVADVNGDHKPDLLVTNAESNTIAVLLGNGDGTFQTAVSYGSGGMFPGSLAVADVNGDGNADVIVANSCGDANCDGSVGVLLGKGDGTFQTAMSYGSGGGDASSIAVADLNGDGKPDVVVTTCLPAQCGKGGEVSVLLGNGDGTLQTAISYSSGGGFALSVTVADVNGDGKPDLLVANLVANTVGVLLGNGDGTFKPAVLFSSDPGSPASVAMAVGVADVDGDGNPDLLVVNQSVGGDGNNGGAVAVLIGNGDGTFQAAVNYGSGAYQARAVAVGDVNGDGRPDLLVVNECIINDRDCDGPINKIRGAVGVLLNNHGAPPTATSLVSNLNPAIVNLVVTYTATVTSQAGGKATGTVTFSDGRTPIATVALAAGRATYSTSYAIAGSHSITATYSGVLNSASGSASAPLTELVDNLHPTMTVVTTSGSPSFAGQVVTITAIVTSAFGAIPAGELVTFFDGATNLGSVALVQGRAALKTSSLSARTHSIKAMYPGDPSFQGSAGTITQVVDLNPTTTVVSSNLNPSHYRQVVRLAARVTSKASSLPTGRVIFHDGMTPIGSATLSSGTAVLPTSRLGTGTHSITAAYGGDSASGKSTSGVLNQVVKQALTATKITSSRNPSSQGQSVTFTARVTSSTGTVVQGTVTFTGGATALGTVTLSGGVGKVETSSLPAGSIVIKAAYGGGTNFGRSSASLKQSVQ